MSTKMIEELAAALDHLVDKSRESQAAAEEAHIVADEARQLLRAVSILGKGRQSDVLAQTVKMSCEDPEIHWLDQSIDIDAEIELNHRDASATVMLNQYTVNVQAHELDALEAEYAEVEFSVQHLVESIAEVIRDYSSSEEQNEAAIAAVATELRNLL